VVVNVTIEDIISKLNMKRREEIEHAQQVIAKNEAKGLKVVGEN
jgi:hypothetical protein